MGDGPDSSLPNEIVQAIAISNAKSIGEQPAILANLALSNQILNNNLAQQMQLSQQAAINQITLATMSRCVAVITNGNEDPKSAGELLEKLEQLLKQVSKREGGTTKASGPTAPPRDEA